MQFIVEGGDYYSIWYSDIEDGFITLNKKILSFNNERDLRKYCQKKSIELAEYITVYDIDDLICKNKVKNTEINCKSVLDFWNIISDASRSLHVLFCGDRVCYNPIYEKLLCGCNLEALSGKYYKPIWTRKEIDTIQDILNKGYRILRKYLLQ